MWRKWAKYIYICWNTGDLLDAGDFLVHVLHATGHTCYMYWKLNVGFCEQNKKKNPNSFETGILEIVVRNNVYSRQRSIAWQVKVINATVALLWPDRFVLNRFPYLICHVTREVINKGAAVDCFFDTSKFRANMASTSRWVAMSYKSFL